MLGANDSIGKRRNAKEVSENRRAQYNASVAQAHQQKAEEHRRVKEANEMRIR